MKKWLWLLIGLLEGCMGFSSGKKQQNEISSLMVAVKLPGQEAGDLNIFVKALKKSSQIKVTGEFDTGDSERRGIEIQYRGKECRIEVFSVPLDHEAQFPQIMNYILEDELKELDEAKEGVGIVMNYEKEAALDYFHLHLQLLAIGMPDLLAVVDVNGQQVLGGTWVRQIAKQKIAPSPRTMFCIHAVEDKEKVWLHTHGLNRCGLPELEILNVDKFYADDEAEVMNVVAQLMLAEKNPILPLEPILTATLANQQHLVCTLVPWDEAVSSYPKDVSGGEDDHQTHSKLSCILSVYRDDAAYEAGKYSPLSSFDVLLSMNPMFWVSGMETERMKTLAQEYIDVLKQVAPMCPEGIVVKLGIEVDDEYKEKGGSEHLWFLLKDFVDDSHWKVELLNAPYYIRDLKEGDVRIYPVELLTDWKILLPDEEITPDHVYKLPYLLPEMK